MRNCKSISDKSFAYSMGYRHKYGCSKHAKHLDKLFLKLGFN